MNIIILFLILLFGFQTTFAQQAVSYDGIQMKFSSVNRSVYYYGEFLNIYADINNTNNTQNKYQKCGNVGNYRIKVKNLSTGEALLI